MSSPVVRERGREGEEGGREEEGEGGRGGGREKENKGGVSGRDKTIEGEGACIIQCQIRWQGRHELLEHDHITLHLCFLALLQSLQTCEQYMYTYNVQCT